MSNYIIEEMMTDVGNSISFVDVIRCPICNSLYSSVELYEGSECPQNNFEVHQ